MNLSLSHIRLLVPNIRDCFRFFRDIIGLSVRYGNEDTPFAEFQTGDINLALEPLIGGVPSAVINQTDDLSAKDRVAVIFRVDDIDAVFEELKTKGVEFVKDPYDETDWGMRIAYLRDPAGNLIELNKGI